MTASWHNIRPEYDNSKLKILKNKGSSWQTTTFPNGVYDYEVIDSFIHNRIVNYLEKKPMELTYCLI